VFGGSVQHVTAAQGLGDDHVYGLTLDQQGRLWWSSGHGLSYAPLKDVLETLEGKRPLFRSTGWGREDGVTGEPIRAFHKSAVMADDGSLYFPALDGLIQVDPHAIVPLPAPRVVLDEVRTEGGQLRFRFSAPQYPSPHKLRFRFRLQGLTEQWSDEDSPGEARFEGVAPGTYTFEVQALVVAERQTDGNITSVVVVVVPPWYETWLFRLLVALAIAGVGGGIYRSKVARAARIAEARIAERRRIAADMHDGLSQDLAGLRLQIDAARASLEHQPGNVDKFLRRAALLLEDGLTDLRDSIWGLNHEDIESSALAEGLHERFLRALEGSAVTLTFKCTGGARTIPAACAWPLIQITREAVTNAVKHAAATRIALTLHVAERELTITVEDDGKGMPAGRSRPGRGGGFGIAGMEARAKAICGTLRVESLAEGGTKVLRRAPTQMSLGAS